MLCKPKSFYDKKNKVAIGYKNPLCLTRVKQAQSALYNGHVLVTTNHTPTVTHDSEDTREIAEITRKRMLLKMQSPLCVENKVRIPPPPDYSKENLLVTFAPQRNLTPEHIFWSIDDNNRKKAETLAPKPISALTVYPPNTPVKLVPRILPTKSQVKINLYDNVIGHLKDLVTNVNDRSHEPYSAVDVTALIEQNNCDRLELGKEAPDFNSFFKIKNLEHQIQEKDNVIRDLKGLVANVNDRSFKPLDNALDYACQYTKLSQELLEYVIGTCPKSFNEKDNKAPSTPVTRKKQVTFSDKPGTSSSNIQKHEAHQKVQQTNIPVIPSTGVNASTEASGSKPRSNTKKNRILPAKKENMKKVEVHLRTNKSVWTKVNRIDSSISYKRVVINSNSESVCKMCDKCLNSANHEKCVVNILSSVNANPTVKRVLNKGKQIWKPKGKLSDNRLNKTKRVWKATGKLFADIGYQWRPTGKKFTLGKLDCGYQWRPTGKNFALGEMCPLTKLSVKCSTISANQQVILWYLDSGCSKHMTGNRSKLMNFVEKFIGTVRFGNDHFGAIMGYGDYVIGDSVISRVYYVEGLGHNLFSVGQFCDSDLEVAFRKHTCFVRDINGADILKGSPCQLEKQEVLPTNKSEKLHKYGSSAYPSHGSVWSNESPKLASTKQSDSSAQIMERNSQTSQEAPDLNSFFKIKNLEHQISSTKRRFQSDIGILVGYALAGRAYRISTRELVELMETISMSQFDEMHQKMAPVRMTQDAPSTSASSSTSDMHHLVRHQGITEEPTHEDSPINHDEKQLESDACGTVSLRKLSMYETQRTSICRDRRLLGFQAMQDEIQEFDHLEACWLQRISSEEGIEFEESFAFSSWQRIVANQNLHCQCCNQVYVFYQMDGQICS
ncbi:hypothetical protein Tco_0601211 [Tanacetum coccineum]